MAENGVAVEIEGLGRRFGTLAAVRDLSLRIRAGETFGLLGPNGAGKTTTLSMLASLLAPSEGDARIFGRSLAGDARTVRRLVGLAPQQLSLYPALTGEENLIFFGGLYGLRRGRLRQRSAAVLEAVGLARRKDDRVQTYSGGMQRRLNLACALVHEPRLLLLDEPTAGVDPQSRDHILAAIQALAAGGITVLYTTHYMEEAERLCDRIAIMDEGRVIAAGTRPELLGLVAAGESAETVNLERVFMHLTGRALRD